MNTDKYILDSDGNPQPEPDLLKWAQWLQNSKDRIVKKTTIGDAEVSTVFLGLDHAFGDTSEPVLWETMVFGGRSKASKTVALEPGPTPRQYTPAWSNESPRAPTNPLS